MSKKREVARMCYTSSSIFRHDIEVIGKPVFSFLGLTLLRNCWHWRTWSLGVEKLGFKAVLTSRLSDYE